MDSAIIELIARIAPSAGKTIAKYFSSRKEIRPEEVQLILLSKVLENESQVLTSQEKIIDTQNRLVVLQENVNEILKNHVVHESKVLEALTGTLDEACENLRNMRADLIRAKVTK